MLEKEMQRKPTFYNMSHDRDEYLKTRLSEVPTAPKSTQRCKLPDKAPNLESVKFLVLANSPGHC